MQVGDLVRHAHNGTKKANRLGVVMRVFMHKLWETDTMGKKVDWNKVQMQPFAEVMWNDGNQGRGTSRLPQKALVVVCEV